MPSGRYQVAIRQKGYPNIYGTFRTKTEAKEFLLLKKAEMSTNTFVDTRKANATTFFTALDTFKETRQLKKGWNAEKYRIKAWQEHDFAKRTLASLKPDDFDAYRDERRRHGVSDATIKQELAIVSGVFKSQRYNLINPARFTTKTLKGSKHRDRRLSKLEEKYLMSELEDTKCSDPKRANKWIPILTRFAIATASRLSEIVSLRWENTDIENSTCQLFDTKNGTDRYSPLSDAAIKSLEAARALGNGRTKGLVFDTTASAIQQSWARAKIRARKKYENDGGTDKTFMVDYHFHDNRHEAASTYARDLNVLQLQMITGHKDIRSLKRYVNPVKDDVAYLAQKMKLLLQQKAEEVDTDIKNN